MRCLARLCAGLVVCLTVLAPAALSARVPPLELLSERQSSLRDKADGVAVDVSISVTSGRLTQWTASGFVAGRGEPLALTHASGGRQLQVGPDSDMPAWRIVFALVAAADPIGELQRHAGQLDRGVTTIEVDDDDFLYVFGELPQIAVSRDLGRIRRVRARLEDTDWEFRLSGDLGAAGLSRRIHVLRAGQPYATVEMSQSQVGGEDD